jgi:hypothetical protein
VAAIGILGVEGLVIKERLFVIYAYNLKSVF